MSLGCGAHQSISFPGNRFYCYGDVCRGTLSTQSGKHTAQSGLKQNILMVKSKETYFQAYIDYMQSCFCKSMYRRHLYHPPPFLSFCGCLGTGKMFTVAVFLVAHQGCLKYCISLAKRQLESTLTPQHRLCLSLARNGVIADSLREAVHLKVTK